MFDIGFWELVLCAVIGLIVLGPQRLPGAVRAVMKWVYTFRSMANQVREELEKEIQLKELKDEIDEARHSGRKLGEQLKDSLDQASSSLHSERHENSIHQPDEVGLDSNLISKENDHERQ
ncbi:MAG: Sec-independent protein translocase protein TatB [Candidatus Celerinatantimonas neptuna]|nr:MAG: Sec-independent protein translocase protein TatB [Candidatus Celerinatantimonas neptuna]